MSDLLPAPGNSSKGHFARLRDDAYLQQIWGAVHAGIHIGPADQSRGASLSYLLERFGKVFWLIVKGDSMAGLGYAPGQLIAISANVNPYFGCKVVLQVEGEEEPRVKLYTERGIFSVYGDRRVREKLPAESEIIGTVVWRIGLEFTPPEKINHL